MTWLHPSSTVLQFNLEITCCKCTIFNYNIFILKVNNKNLIIFSYYTVKILYVKNFFYQSYLMYLNQLKFINFEFP